uniref:Transcription repressor n=1 Tax=Chenopodium quinoa TaxID=63459 RepID=A0A803M1R3_CHEQI
MQGRRSNKFKGTGGCRALCCTNCRTSTEGDESSGSSDRYPSISSLAHHMVQERLDQMIKENEEEKARSLMEARKRKQKKKSSHDPMEDFRRSMVEVILANRIKEPNDLRYLLKCYITMNSVEYRGIILEAFHQWNLE